MTKIYYDSIDHKDPWLFEINKDVWVFLPDNSNVYYLRSTRVEIYIKRSQLILQYE